MNPIVFGICSALLIGTADFLAALAGRKTGSFITLFYSMGVSFVILVIIELFIGAPLIQLQQLLILLLIGLAATTGYLSFYKALELGPVSLVAPIASSDGAIAALIGLVFFGEILTALQGAGLILVFLGILLVSADFSQIRAGIKHPGKGTLYALITMLGFGITLAGISWFSQQYGWFMPILGIRFAIIVPLIIIAAGKRRFKPAAKLEINTVLTIIGIGALETLGLLAFTSGTAMETQAPTAIVASIYATFPIITVILSYFIFKERPVRNQWAGIIGVIAGMILLSIR